MLNCIQFKSRFARVLARNVSRVTAAKNKELCSPLRQRRHLIITSLTLPLTTSKAVSNPALPRATPVEISRIMVPDDTNPAGNVHGGTILKLLEQAGHVVANRHCNQNRGDSSNPPITTALVRLEKMDFLQPMHVGEVAQLQAAVTYTSKHSLEVTVDVWAENVLIGNRRHTNTATLWYVPLIVQSSDMKYGRQEDLKDLITTAPPLQGLTEAQLEAGKKRYDTQRLSRDERELEETDGALPAHVFYYPKEVGEGTVLASQSTLANIVLPSDCTVTGHMTGGALMKMMDSSAGICATRHCRSRTVTACIDVINFHCAITNGEIVFVTARVIFTSSKSMEIEVTVEAEGLVGRRITNTAYFTFVSLGKDCHAQAVPPLVCKSKEDETRFEEGKKRYSARKKARIEAYKVLMQTSSKD